MFMPQHFASDRDHPASCGRGRTIGASGRRRGTQPVAIERCQGVTRDLSSRRDGRSSPAVDRVLDGVRARRVIGEEIPYIYDPSFALRSAEATILAPMPEHMGGAYGGHGLSPYTICGDAPLLSRGQEVYLFRKMNYLKYRANTLRAGLDPARARAADLDEIERLKGEALADRNQIICANLRLVLSIVKRYAGPSTTLCELISDGNMSLIRAVEKFDYARGYRFSTYAARAIVRNLTRSMGTERSSHYRFVTGRQGGFEAPAAPRTDEHENERGRLRNQAAVRRMLDWLSDREREVIASRFGLEGAREKTLSQLGEELGITRQRVGQIESRAQEKLRKFALEQGLEPTMTSRWEAPP